MQLADCDRIYRAAWLTEDQVRFKELCLELLEVYKLLSIVLARGNVFWRARVATRKAFGNISDLSYPPPEKARSGRLNRQGRPCFYLSSTPETAIQEVLAGPGQLVQVAGYKIQPGQELHLILIGEFAHVYKRGYTSLSGVDPGNSIGGILMRNQAQTPVMISIDKFFAAILSDPKAHETDYMRTQGLAELLHKKLPKANGIAFPSVRDPLGFNFGVLTEVADQIFENTCCTLELVGELHMYGVFVPFPLEHAIGTTGNGDFMWAEKRIADQYYQYSLTEEEKEEARKAGRLADGRIRVKK